MPNKLCRVCGDRSIGFNFNVVTCESCKTLFRRHALKLNLFHCIEIGKCEISKSSRKNCISCRMEKCLAAGMDKNLIFSRNDRKLKSEQAPQETIQMHKNTTDLKGHELDRLIEIREAVSVFREEDNFALIRESQNTVEIANLQETLVTTVIQFCKKLSAFKNLTSSDQLILFKTFFPKRCLIRGALHYNHEDDGFTVIQDESERKAIFIRMSIVKTFAQQPNAYSLLRKLCHSMKMEIENDFTIRDLFSTLLLFKECTNLANREHANYHYILYSYLLKRYLEHKYASVEKATRKYHSLMSTLQLIDDATEQMKKFYKKIQRNPASPGQIAQVLKEIYDS